MKIHAHITVSLPGIHYGDGDRLPAQRTYITRLKTGIGLMLNVWLQMGRDMYPRFLPRTPSLSASRRPRRSCCTRPSVTSRPRPRTWGHSGTSPPPGHNPHRGSRTESPRCRTRGHCQCCRWGRSCRPRSFRSIPAKMKNYTTFTK